MACATTHLVQVYGELLSKRRRHELEDAADCMYVASSLRGVNVVDDGAAVTDGGIHLRRPHDVHSDVRTCDKTRGWSRSGPQLQPYGLLTQQADVSFDRRQPRLIQSQRIRQLQICPY